MPKQSLNDILNQQKKQWKLRQRYKPGQKVKLTQEAADHYGRHDEMTIASVFNKYCPAKTHFAHGHSYCTGHPGFDDATGDVLYEMSNGDNFNCAVYDYELE